ncbi:hypothetical protein Enr13x_09480 [Stieleria neptunia]|uniref:Uncharacterized protein n=2 Tax=Stieleria neptunia TaxID=2527979 RepID=A0A518HK14_9BACT|nr:hypothetical protein Enr13x_09480 [Stieleria neptunia]
MLTRLIARSDAVAESPVEYNAGTEYEYRDAECEYEYDQGRKPEPSQNQAVHLRAARAVSQVENHSSVPGDGNRSSCDLSQSAILRIRFRTRSLLALIVLAATLFATVRYVDARRRSTCTYQVNALRAAIGKATRVEILAWETNAAHRIVGDTIFFAVDSQPEIQALSDSSLWPAESKFEVLTGPIGWAPRYHFFIHVVNHDGTTHTVLLEDETLQLRNGMVKTRFEHLCDHILETRIERSVDGGDVTIVRDYDKVMKLFTGLPKNGT